MDDAGAGAGADVYFVVGERREAVGDDPLLAEDVADVEEVELSLEPD